MTKRLLRRCGAAALVASLLLSGVARPAAQQPVAPTQAPQQPQPPAASAPYPLRMSADRALALARAAGDRLPYVPGEVLIKFRDGVTLVEQDRALSALRSRPPASALDWTGDVAVLRDAFESDAEILAERLSAQPEVEYAEPNYIYKRAATPNDPSFSTRQWNLTSIGMERAWDINPGSRREIVVAIVDSGVTTVNETFTFQTWDGSGIRSVDVPFRISPDLSASKLSGGRDFVFWDGPVVDMEGHGTHVASTVGQDANNELAEAGIAYDTSIMPLKACFGYWDLQFTLSAEGYQGFVPPGSGGCAVSDVSQAVRYAADNGAQVINISLGGPSPSRTLRDALVYAVQRGSFVAVAMGNEYEDGNATSYPAGYAADIDGVVSVASVGRSLKRAYYSNTGAHAELAAPGGDARDGGLSGLIWQVTIAPGDSDSSTVIVPRFDRYAEVPQQGTSMASPHVAGIAALIVSQGVTAPAAVEALLTRTAKDLGQPGRDNEYGFGLVQPRSALLGFGLAR